MKRWRKFEGRLGYEGSWLEIICPCGEHHEIYYDDVREVTCRTCGREYTLEVVVTPMTRGEGNGHVYVPPPPPQETPYVPLHPPEDDEPALLGTVVRLGGAKTE